MERRTFVKTVGAAAAFGSLGSGVTAAEIPEKGIEILTDEYNVSHVYAADLYDLAYGQGWVQARDRLFQMDLMRMVGRGESARVVGPGQLPSDISVRRDLYSEAELQEQWENAEGELKEAMEGFAEGVNDKMEEMDRSGDMPGEFSMLGRDPEPWEPTDTVAVVSYTIGFFGVNGGHELTNARNLAEMFERFDTEAAAWEAYHDRNRAVVPEEHYGSLKAHEVDETDQRALDYDEVPDEQLAAIRAARGVEPWGVDEFDIFEEIQEFFRDPLGAFSGGFGSNAIVVGGEHTRTGKPMLGGGPQMSLLKPPVIHEVGLHGDGFDVAGIGVVGAPGVIIGRTPEFAWTMTTSNDDMVDTIAVDLHPNDRYRYRWDGEWHDLVTETYEHRPNMWAGIIDGAFGPQYAVQEVAFVEQEGTRMPVVSYNPDENVAFVQRATTRMEEFEGALTWMEVGRANSREEFEAVFEDFPFGFNFFYVDEEDIAHYRTGKLAHGDDGADPRLPTPEQYHDWRDFDVGLDLGANAVNPERGYVVCWNNAPAPGWRNNDSEGQFRAVHRVDVMERLVQEALSRTGGNLSLSDVEGIIEDCSVEHPFAPRVVPHLVGAARGSDDPTLQAVADELETWAARDYAFRPGGDGRYPDGGMAIWETVRHELQEVMFADTLGPRMPELEFDPTAGDGLSGAIDPHVADHGPTIPKCVELVETLEGRANYDWLGDDVDATLGESLSSAASTLSGRFRSDDPEDWRLDAREAEFMPLGGGEESTIPISNRASYQQSIAMRTGRDEAASVLPPSNVGHIGFWELLGGLVFDEPARLTRQLDLYESFGYKHHPVTRDRVERFAVEEELLDPRDELADDGGSGGDGPGFALPVVGGAIGLAALLGHLRDTDAGE